MCDKLWTVGFLLLGNKLAFDYIRFNGLKKINLHRYWQILTTLRYHVFVFIHRTYHLNLNPAYVYI